MMSKYSLLAAFLFVTNLVCAQLIQGKVVRVSDGDTITVLDSINTQIISYMPIQFADYSIEWSKTRLKNFVKKIGETAESEYIYQLSTTLPYKTIQQAMEAVGKDWLDDNNKKT